MRQLASVLVYGLGWLQQVREREAQRSMKDVCVGSVVMFFYRSSISRRILVL